MKPNLGSTNPTVGEYFNTFIDNILISKAVIDLYKDRRKPYDKRLYKELPHLALKKMEFPLYIKQINIDNSLLLLEESFPNKNMNLKLSINKINAIISNISTIEEYKEIPIKAKLEASLKLSGRNCPCR